MKNKKTKKNYLANHQRSWVWGRHAVSEILDAGRWPVLELYLDEALSPDISETASAKAAALGAQTLLVPHARLRELCGATEHQGWLARMGPFPYATLDEIITEASNVPLYLVLDSLRDPFNFGAIIRSAAALNATAVIVGEQEQCPVNNHVARTSAGAVNRIPVVRTESLLSALTVLRETGVHCVATTPRATRPLWQCDFTRSTALILGNESQGITDEISAQCDEHVVIPGNTELDSLNVAAAATALLYEALRQRA